ncbi:MAG: hypothetical protein CL944_02995 [Candidatus Diapherotrites archaeon]|uniref:Transcription regulator TrmB N-terminal domain-containing protein n=1 Tax=Candidatus Iainarchaeum sp. TaxID=3101447 RepID=A0A2D6LQH3_9ARCH|nr:hypothetical protein [Candidatus Diapherotrites archaeon]
MIESIKKLGLNEYEARAYNALLDNSKASAVFVSKSSNIPRARVYDVLFSLEKKGFVTRSASKPIEFRVVKPLTAVESVSETKQKELDKNLEEFKVIAKTLEQKANIEADFSDSAWVVEGRRNIYSKIAEQLENTKENVLICSSESGLKRKKGYFDKKLASLTSKGVKVISKPSLSSRFVVFDKNSVMLFLNQEKGSEDQEKALLINSPFVANYFYLNGKK